MKIIGLTGGIGSGKTTVSHRLKEKGYPVIDADAIARDLTAAGSPLLPELAAAFGPEILLPGGSLDRKALGRLAFGTPEKKELLDRITHKAIKERIDEELEACRKMGSSLVFLDVPLLFETGLDALAEEVWLVDAEDRVRISRIMARDGLPEEDILQRMAAQMEREEKVRRSHRILDNSGTREALYQQIEVLLGEMN